MTDIANIQLNSALKDAVDAMIHGTGLTCRDNGNSVELINHYGEPWGTVQETGTDEHGNQLYKYDSTVNHNSTLGDYNMVTNSIHDDMANSWDFREVPKGVFRESMENINPKLRKALVEAYHLCHSQPLLTEGVQYQLRTKWLDDGDEYTDKFDASNPRQRDAFAVCHKKPINESEFGDDVSEYKQYVEAQLNTIVQYMTKYGGSTDATSKIEFDQENFRSYEYAKGTIGDRIVKVNIENYGSHPKGDLSLTSLENGTFFHISTEKLNGSREYKDIYVDISDFNTMSHIFSAIKMDAPSFEPAPSQSWDQWWNEIKKTTMVESVSSASKRKWIRKMYAAAKPLLKGLKRDDAWQNVWQLFATIEKAVPEVSFDVGTTDGGYQTNSDGMKSKVYDIVGQTPEGFPINGQLVCAFAGPSDNPESCYDMSLILN